MGATTTAKPQLMAPGRIVPSILSDFLAPVAGVLTVSAVILDKKKLRFSAEFKRDLDGTPQTFTIANANGKQRVFSDIDSIVRLAQKVSPIATKVVVTIDETNVLNPSESLGNPVDGFKKLKTKYEADLVLTNREKTAADIELVAVASFQTGTPAQQEKYDDVQARVAALANAQTFYTDEIARLTALIPA